MREAEKWYSTYQHVEYYADSYKSIPKKLQRICVKNLSKFQKRIASDAFLGQALVGSISALGLVAIIIVSLI